MKQIIKNFNNIVKKTIFKVQNKTNNNFNIGNFNKCLITLIFSLFVYLFYLLTPLLYDKTWVQSNIESKLFNEFKIRLSTSANISYRILPAPHFLIKDSKIFISDSEKHKKSIAEIKNFKVFVSKKNLFNKELMKIKKIIINDANFFFLKHDAKILNVLNIEQFPEKNIRINNSNIFFKDNLNEIITIIKVNKANVFFDDEKLLNVFDLKGEIFGIPFVFDFKGKNDYEINNKINLKADSLKLNIFNESIIKNNGSNNGKNIISLFNSKIKTKYKVQEKLVSFESDASKLGNSKIDYNGELSINPFNLDLSINLKNHRISHLFNFNPIFKELVKSEILFNENLNVKLSIFAKTNARDEVFQNAKINFNILRSKLNFDNTVFVNDDIGLLELNKSNLFLKDNKLILNTDMLITIKDLDGLFSLLNTNKKSRKEIKNIFINLDYDFLGNQIKFNNIKIDNNKVSNQFLNIVEGFSDNNLNNMIKSRRLINELFNTYEG